MIIEYIRYSVPALRHGEFVEAYRAASDELSASPHCLAYELSRCHEQPDLYVMRIEWNSLSGHVQGFRGSPEFKAFLAKVQPFFQQIQEMQHYETSEVVARKSAAADNVKLIERVYEAFLSGDVPAVVTEFAADGVIEFEGASPLVPWHERYRGAPALPKFFSTFAAAVEFERFDREAVVASADFVVVRAHLRYRVRSTGRVVDERQIHFWQVSNGKVSTMTHYEDTAQVIAAVTTKH